jgi:hypothetical protein
MRKEAADSFLKILLSGAGMELINKNNKKEKKLLANRARYRLLYHYITGSITENRIF